MTQPPFLTNRMPLFTSRLIHAVSLDWKTLPSYHYPPPAGGFYLPGKSWCLVPDSLKASLSLHFLPWSSGILSLCGFVSPSQLDLFKDGAQHCLISMYSILHSTRNLVGAQDMLAKWVGAFCCCLPPTCSWIFLRVTPASLTFPSH